MSLITPTQLLERIQIAQRATPNLVKEALEKSKLEKINIDNLQQGKDSDGENLPRYRNPEYANFKVTANPRNRGFWDLRLTGQYYSGIKVKIYPAIVFFTQVISNEKIDWIEERVGKTPLGITEDQMIEVQLKNAEIIRTKLLKIING